jgi:hypothetical protein
MKDFSVGSAWSNARLSPYDQVSFFFQIDSLVPERHRAYAMQQLADIIGPQRWGLPRAAPKGWNVYFKGGWRRSGGRGRWLVNQTGLLADGTSSRLAVSVLTDSDPGFSYGTESVRGVGARLLFRAAEFY